MHLSRTQQLRLLRATFFSLFSPCLSLFLSQRLILPRAFSHTQINHHIDVFRGEDKTLDYYAHIRLCINQNEEAENESNNPHDCKLDERY